MNPITTLYQEHAIIVDAVEVAREAEKLIEKDNEAYLQTMKLLLHFFRVYSDQYHHHKEEEILFPEMNKKNELLEDGVVKEMFENHEDFRNMINTIENHLNTGEYVKAQQQLQNYTEALLDHIAVENDEVFQMAETLFDESELERIYFRFEDCDREIGEQQKTDLVNQLREIKATLMYSQA